ncbi:AraC family transcriptional regulator [Marinomonas sp. C1424]|uniref:AraC family transcriptional regulator n=2 Tax=Marinomonas transparens TaxID=2795388 RepID=A0A934JU37_9GAMM|nr:AraC family transcriptional regulator [Marinomonas transparens]
MQQLAPKEGYNLTSMKDVRLLRSNRKLTKTPVLYEPGIVIVCQGRKHGYFGDQCYIYDESQYLAVSIPVPFSMETEASFNKPLLAIYITLDFKLAAELILLIEQQDPDRPTELTPESMIASPMTPELQDCVTRFLHVLDKPLDVAALGQSLLRELYFHFLTGSQGNVIRSAVSMRGQFGKVSQVLKYIHSEYSNVLNLATLAAIAQMSVPTFCTHFKAITHMTPMQYVKSVRLHQARMMMLRQAIPASTACHAVGYESPSQFNREFKRLFGLPPATEVKRLKENFSYPPTQNIDYVSSH